MEFPVTILDPRHDPRDWFGVTPPLRLYAQGAPALLERLPARGLGVVGSRSPTVSTKAHLREWISLLQGRDLIVVSGFARGTDAIAHEAALEAGLPTVAVLGAGIDVDYPSGHAALRRGILESGGLLVTEFPAGVPPRAGNFHRRNRLIAAWSAAVVVAQAANRSGALNTAWWARRLERACFAHPCPPSDPLFAGNQRLIDEEAALPLWHAHSLGAAWLELATLRPPARRPRVPLPGDARSLERLLLALAGASGGARPEESYDRAAHSMGWSASRFHAALAALIKSGRFREEGGVLFPNTGNQTRNRRIGESVKS